MSISNEIIPKNITKKQIIDSGMALVLILLILGFWLKNNLFFKIAVPVLVINIIIPKIFYPFAVFWFSLANILSATVSKILLSVVYFIIVMPVGLLRRLFGKDSLFLTKFKRDSSSVMITRNHTFTSKDILNPY
ncbi:MAG: hypothetical protein JW894_07675 [Bacteroidales bacterium]|nr:hypothetical protein [Bacteroidales bacterium]